MSAAAPTCRSIVILFWPQSYNSVLLVEEYVEGEKGCRSCLIQDVSMGAVHAPRKISQAAGDKGLIKSLFGNSEK